MNNKILAQVKIVTHYRIHHRRVRRSRDTSRACIVVICFLVSNEELGAKKKIKIKITKNNRPGERSKKFIVTHIIIHGVSSFNRDFRLERVFSSSSKSRRNVYNI